MNPPPRCLPIAKAAQMYGTLDAERRKKGYAVQADLKRDLQPGFLIPYLLEVETMLWGRWDYWTVIQLSGALPEEGIPRISFTGLADSRGNHAMRMLERCVKAAGGGGWSLSTSIEAVLDFALFGFGYLKELPTEPCEGAWMALYQLFDLWPMLIWPYDYWGDMMAEAEIGKGQDFYPTPHEVVEAMTLMNFVGEIDYRAKTVCDPCVGTGRMLLHASNYSLRLYAQDISHLAVKTTIFNGYLYAPWLAKGIAFDDAGNVVQSEQARLWNRIAKMDSLLRGDVETVPPVISLPAEQAEVSNHLFAEADFTVDHVSNTPPLMKKKGKAGGERGDQFTLDLE